jgi:Ran GTPase-activating protein (RanGAP) involved in mRNA processing and transport
MEPESSVMERKIEAIWQPLKNNEYKVQYLDLGVMYPYSLDSKIQQISEVIRKNNTLRTLAFCGSKSRAYGVLSGENLTTEFYEAIRVNRALHTLNLEACTITDEALNRLFEVLSRSDGNRTLKVLNLSLNPITNVECVANAFAQNIALEDLDLSNCRHVEENQWDKLFDGLAANSNLLRLKLSNAKLTSSNAIKLAATLEKKNHSLQVLELRQNGFKDDGGKSLVKMLEFNRGLIHLDLSYNKLTAASFESFPKSMAKNQMLSILTVERNDLDSLGAAYIAQGLAVNSTLCTLKMAHCIIHDSGLKAIVESLSLNGGGLKDLGIGFNGIAGKENDGLYALIDFLNSAESLISSLDVSGNLFSAKAFLENLSSNHSVRALTMNKVDFDEGAMDELVNLLNRSPMIALDLGGCKISDVDLGSFSKTLAVNNALRSLSLDDNAFMGPGSKFLAEALQTNNVLETLFFGSNNLGSEGPSAFGEMLKVNTNLQFLSFNKTLVTNISELCDGIAANRNLDVVFLQLNELTDSNIPDLVKVIENNSSMFAFWIDENKFSEEGCQKLELAMEKNTSIIRSVNADFRPPITYCLQSILRNQQSYLEQIQLALGSFMIREAEAENGSRLVDLKQFFSLVWNFYNLPQVIYWKTKYSDLFV